MPGTIDLGRTHVVVPIAGAIEHEIIFRDAHGVLHTVPAAACAPTNALAAELNALRKLARAVDRQMNEDEVPTPAEVEDAMGELRAAVPWIESQG